VDTPLQDRLAALRRMAPDDLAGLLRRVPALAAALSGHGPLAPFSRFPGRGRRGARGPGLRAFAELLVSPPAIDHTLASLTRFELQLATLAAWHGGTLTREQALAETGGDGEARLDDAAGVLARLLLSDPVAGWVALRPGVAQVVGLPGIGVRPTLELLTSDELARRLTRLGQRPVPTRKVDRIEAFEALLRDGDALRAALKRLPDDARRVFLLLAEHGPQRVRDLGIPYFTPYAGQRTPLHELSGLGLVGVDFSEQLAWVWLDVLVGLAGRLFADWRSAPPPMLIRPLSGTGSGLPPVLARLGALFDAWAADPPPALASGGLGVRPIRAVAKQLGMRAGEAGLLAHLAVNLGLLGRNLVATNGRGRQRSELAVWAPTELAARWSAQRPARRWALLVQAWRDDPDLDEAQGLPERVDPSGWQHGRGVFRDALLGLLADLPPGQGVEMDRLAEVAAFTRPGLLGRPGFAGLVAAARALGLVPATGPVGLTGPARALLEGVDVLEAALPRPCTEFTVQADHSIVAPPDLAPDIAGRLERYADLESDAGARLYRLTERRVAAALDAGEDADDVLAFLRSHSSTPVPQNVAYLVADVGRRHGQLRAGECGSYLRCDDPALLSRAAGVKGAKLRVLAPTVAVSALSRDRLVAALRERGLMPVCEAPDGTVLPTARTVADPVLHAAAGLPRLRPAMRGEELDALAKALLDTPQDELELDAIRR
jgi:hypothetical protein